MSKRKIKLQLPRLHLLAVVSASIMFGCAFILSPDDPAGADVVRVAIPVPGKILETSGKSETSRDLPGIAQPDQIADEVSQKKITNPSGHALISEIKSDESASPPPSAVTLPPAPELTWKRFKVASGDSLYRLFSRAGLSAQQLAAMNASIDDKSWTNLFPGEKLEFGFSTAENGEFKALKIHRSRLERWQITALPSGKFEFDKQLDQPDVQLAYAEATINSSLFIDAKKAGMSDNITMELANIFGWDIDFILDIRKGDSFKLVYEEFYVGDDRIGEGNILSAQFVNQGKAFTAIRFEDSKGRVSYYTPDGDSMKKAFRRSPLDFARISSHFNLKRKHPVLHKIRAHKGTDYAAGRGTPIKSTGDGKVIFAGRKGGYGKVVIIQHGQSISTLYAHMKGYARGIRSGKRVSQGQVIGYVGSTGMATGPHLHYEFRVNGIHKNPITVKLPKAHPVAKAELKRFRAQAEMAVAQLESYAEGFQIAQSESSADTRDL